MVWNHTLRIMESDIFEITFSVDILAKKIYTMQLVKRSDKGEVLSIQFVSILCRLVYPVHVFFRD